MITIRLLVALWLAYSLVATGVIFFKPGPGNNRLTEALLIGLASGTLGLILFILLGILFSPYGWRLR